jgi:15-cis-phytoene synthase
MMRQSPEIRRSYQWCYDVARRSRSSFYLSFWLLKRPARQAMFALYAFSRYTDDWGDNDWGDSAQGEKTQGEKTQGDSAQGLQSKRQCLARWRQLLWTRAGGHSGESRVLGGAVAGQAAGLLTQPLENCMDSTLEEQLENRLAECDPLWAGLREAIGRFQIPVELLDDIITGVECDLEPVRLRDQAELDRYCYHVASAVGLACTHIWQARPGLSRQAAIDCGIAFQLTNILRDIREDAERGRIYLPLEELEAHRCAPETWLAGRPEGDWQNLVRDNIRRARRLYASGWRTIEHLPPAGAKMFSLMWHSYAGLLSEVESHVERLWDGPRITLARGQRLRLVATHFLNFGSRLKPRLPAAGAGVRERDCAGGCEGGCG